MKVYAAIRHNAFSKYGSFHFYLFCCSHREVFGGRSAFLWKWDRQNEKKNNLPCSNNKNRIDLFLISLDRKEVEFEKEKNRSNLIIELRQNSMNRIQRGLFKLSFGPFMHSIWLLNSLIHLMYGGAMWRAHTLENSHRHHLLIFDFRNSFIFFSKKYWIFLQFNEAIRNSTHSTYNKYPFNAFEINNYHESEEKTKRDKQNSINYAYKSYQSHSKSRQKKNGTVHSVLIAISQQPTIYMVSIWNIMIDTRIQGYFPNS